MAEEETKYFDSFGREVEAHTCEYCGQTKPVQLWSGIEDSREKFQILMVEYQGYNERKMWRCVGCANDIKNRLQGKET